MKAQPTLERERERLFRSLAVEYCFFLNQSSYRGASSSFHENFELRRRVMSTMFCIYNDVTV